MLLSQALQAPGTPVVGAIQIFGSSGQAPLAVHVHAQVGTADWATGTAYTAGQYILNTLANATYVCTQNHTSSASTEPGVGASWSSYWELSSYTGSGWWPEGRWQYQFLKSDGSQLDAADRNWMRVTDPITGSLVYTDDRYSASPTAAFMFRSSGSYKVRVRYQNRDKIWSDWVESATITVSANSRTKRYVNGSTGSDSYDGTSPTVDGGGVGPKLTMNGVLALVSGNNWEIEAADDTTIDCNSQVNLEGWTGTWVHRSGSGAAKPKVVLKQSGKCVILGSSSTFEGVEFEYDGVTKLDSVYYGANKTNVSIVDCSYNEVSSILESGSDRFPTAVLLLRLEQLERVERYCLYIDGVTSVSVLGCSFSTGGSYIEHIVRVATGSKYIAVECSTLTYVPAYGGKSSFRCYARHVGVYRSILKNGSVSLGNIDLDTSKHRDYCLDGSKILFDVVSPTSSIYLWENVGRVVLRTSYIEKNGVGNNPLIELAKNADAGVSQIVGVRFLNLSIKNIGTSNNSTTISAYYLTPPPLDIVVRGCLYQLDAADWSWGVRFALGVGDSDWMFEDNVDTTVPGNEFNRDGVNYTVAQANAEPWADGLILEDHTLSSDGEPLGAGTLWTTAVSSAQGVFRSLNGVEWETAGPASCWRS